MSNLKLSFDANGKVVFQRKATRTLSFQCCECDFHTANESAADNHEMSNGHSVDDTTPEEDLE